jgi:hypothetical protein
MSYKRSKGGRHSNSDPKTYETTPVENLPVTKKSMDDLVTEFIDWQTDGQPEKYDYNRLTIEKVAEYLRKKEEQKTLSKCENNIESEVDPASLFSETITRFRDQAPPVESKVDEANPIGEEVNESVKVSDVTETNFIYEPVVDPGCLYPNFRSRTMGQGDFIRGDLRIAPDNNSHHSRWFHVSVNPERDLRKGVVQLDGIDKDGFLNTPAV